MDSQAIFMSVLLISFLQIVHIFEEIGQEAYSLHKGKNPRGLYLRVAAVLVLLNYIVLWALYNNCEIAYYLTFYSVIISAGNLVPHFILFIKDKKKLGYGFPSSIPLGMAGFYLLWLLIKHFTGNLGE